MEEKCLESDNLKSTILVNSQDNKLSSASSLTSKTNLYKRNIATEETFIVDAGSSISLLSSQPAEAQTSQNLLLCTNRPSTSRNSMSLLTERETFAKTQHDFSEVLDDETKTSGMLETFEIGSSNSLPIITASDVVATVAVEDSSSTDTIKLVEELPTDSSYGNNEFYHVNNAYVINDDDDDDDADDDVDENVNAVAEEVDGSSSEDLHTKIVDNLPCLTAEESVNQLNGSISHLHNSDVESESVGNLLHVMDGSHMKGVIVANGAANIYLETPIELQHHASTQLLNINGEQLEYVLEKAGKPKRLSDEFLLAEAAEATTRSHELAEHEEFAPIDAKYKFKMTELTTTKIIEDKSESESAEITNAVEGVSAELQHEKMSSRLKRMNISNSSSSSNNLASSIKHKNDLASSSLLLNSSTSSASSISSSSSSSTAAGLSMSEIESMDLIERRDFETEQRLTGGIILKSSSLINSKNMLNLNLSKSCLQQQQQESTQKQRTQHKADNEANDDCPSSSSCERAVSSDSKCGYRDLTTTPTSSRTHCIRLTKSTAKLNLCSSLSQTKQQQAQSQRPKAFPFKNIAQYSLSTSNTTTTPAVSVIVEAPASTSNSSVANDELPLAATINANDATNLTYAAQQQQHKQYSAKVDEEHGCSRTSPLNTVSASMSSTNAAALDEDAQPSTSSARCQYAPPTKNLRPVHASAQTNNDLFLLRQPSSTATGSANAAAAATSSAACVPITLSQLRKATHAGPGRRRVELLAHLRESPKQANAFRSAVGAAPLIDLNVDEDAWGDCEENNSDIEEVCTCYHGHSSVSGGSNNSLNETDDFDVLGAGGELSSYIQTVSITEEDIAPTSPDYFSAAVCTTALASNGQRKRKYNESRLLDCGNDSPNANGSNAGSCFAGSAETNASRKRIAYDYASTPSSSAQSNAILLATTPTSSGVQLATAGSKRTPRSLIPTRENPPPEMDNWLEQFQRWSHVERLLAVDRLIEHCEPTQVRHMMKVIEPQFQRDFISLLPRELALEVLGYLEPKDLLRAAQTCRSWRFLCDDNLLWKEKCRKVQILTETRSDRPKRGRAGNMPPIASPWKAAYIRQHTIEMNWRSRPIREPKVLKGHDDHVITCLQFSGNRIVSGSDDNTLKVWSAVTGRCLRTLMGHTGGVWSSQMAGNIIISGSTDRTLKVWDMETGQCVHTLLGHTSTVRCMHLHGTKVVSGSRDATLRVWDIDQGSCLHVLTGHLAAVRCVQYDGKLIVSGAYDYMVKIWHPERQECLHTLQGHTNRVYSLQFDGLHVVSGSLDTSIRVWDVETGNCKHTLMGHQSLTSGMELRQNILVSGNADSTVKVWDITTGQCLQTLSGPHKHQSAVTCLQFNSRFVVTSSDDGTVKLWDVKTGEFIRNLVALDSGGSGGVVWRIRANDTKLICAVGSRNGTEETKLMVLDFDVEGACVMCS